jgi:hypothetical protein
MAESMKLLIADDLPARLDEWVRRLGDVPEVQAHFKIDRLEPGELQDALDELERRRRADRSGKDREDEQCRFDDAELLIVDYDLTELERHSSETGVGLAYLARCFSDCGYIVALNQFGENPFDLSGLGDYSGFADLDLGGSQLSNPGLWDPGAKWPEFRPWAWPLLTREVARLERLTQLVSEAGLGAQVLGVLGLDDQMATALTPESAVHLGAPDIRDATFANMLAEPGMGLRIGDRISRESREHRAAAARATQWLERWILGAQDRLVDAPHLALNYPSQLTGELQDTVRSAVEADATGLQPALLDSHRYEPSDWLTRPAWWATSLAVDERLPEVDDPWGREELDLVFCEDASSFLRAADAIAFRTDVPAANRLRYARRFDGVDYRPLANFATT